MGVHVMKRTIQKGLELGGIVLAGGGSRRIGKDKATLLFRGKPLIKYPLDLLEMYCDEIVISCEKDKYPNYNFRKVPDEFRWMGPLSGIYSCLKASKKPRFLVLACDMPFLSEKLIEHLIANSGDHELVLPFHAGHFEPLCGIYSASLLPVIEQLFTEGTNSPLCLIPKVNFKKLPLNGLDSFYNDKLFHNINTLPDQDIPE